jgi:XTP/dITP diphosphohydrolase
VHGKLSFPPGGEKGFGYDPVFRPVGFDRTFAQMSLEEKNTLSHRGRAVGKLVDFLREG